MSQVPQPRLKLIQGQRVLREHEIPADGELIVGRTQQCAVVIADPSVSRMHARIFTDPSGVYLEDLGSSNGTYVENENIDTTVKLRDGQLIRVGQKASTQPILILFEDPRERLLKEMGLASETVQEPEKAAGEPQEPPPAAGPPEVPAPPDEVPGDGGPVDPNAEAAEGQEQEGEEPVGDRPPGALALLKNPLVIAGAVISVVVFAVLVIWLRSFLQPASTIWRSIQLNPPEVSAGTELTLQSPDIYPNEKLTVFLAGEEIEDFSVTPGRLTVEIPGLAESQAGRFSLPFKVRLGDLDLVQATLTYQVLPTITSVSPPEALVGETLVVEGSGFVADRSQVEAWLGDHAATVVSATPSRLEIRVPVLVRQGTVVAPVRVRVQQWDTMAASPVLISPKLAAPLDFSFRAGFVTERGFWEVRHPLGLAFLLQRPSAPTPEPSPDIQEILDGLEALFEAAAMDPTLTVQTRIGGGRYRLQSTGGSRSSATTVVSWTEEDLALTAAEGRADVTPDMLCYWMAGVWNHFLDAFARGKLAEVTSSSPAYLQVLNRLVQINTQYGGEGRPEEADVAELSQDELRALDRAFLDVPESFGNLSGTWTVNLAGVFYPDGNQHVELTLHLTQRGRGFGGQAEIKIKGKSLEFGLPNTAVSGTLAPGIPPEIHLELTASRPVGRLRLDGTVSSGGIAGTFTSSLEAGSGRFEAKRAQ